MKNIIHPYKKDSQYSYTAGAYATIELLQTRPQHVQQVFVHSDYKDADGLAVLCRNAGIPLIHSDAAFRRINQKENTYAAAQFAKYNERLAPDLPHVMLVNPSDMGNLGTIIRTIAAFGITNLAIVTPAADYWHPKTVRASMGAVFRINIEEFATFKDYRTRFGQHALFPFMLDGNPLDLQNSRLSNNRPPPYTLIFGNEASGLPASYKDVGTSVRLPQTDLVDSLNLSVAVGIAVYAFATWIN